MPLRPTVRALLLLALALLAACATQPGSAPLATLPPSPTAASAMPTTEPAAPTSVPTAAPTAPVLAGGDVTGPYAGIPRSRTPEGYQVLGDPDAPVTLVMYSDFL